MLVHGTAIALDDRAILLMGPSGAGKSDLALRAIDDGAVLIADDLVKIDLDRGLLHAERPTSAAPLLAVRGIGVIKPDRVTNGAPLALCVQLGSAHEPAPLLDKAGPWHGLFVPQIMLDPFEASALIKLHLALARFGF
jgi:serine kinase of HPr protein (carbohydrate metabolism regulator)